MKAIRFVASALRPIDSFVTKSVPPGIEHESRYEVLREPERFDEKLVSR